VTWAPPAVLVVVAAAPPRLPEMVLTVLDMVEVKALVMVLTVLSGMVLVLPPLVTVDAEPTMKSVVVPVVVDAGMVVTVSFAEAEEEAAEAAEL